ncbi:unnamed protein product [Adineta ricciae]|uniref:Uncharacterized protein n=1 Tax=Adineta ricciae TaxID=249248 RepID=A0A815PS35_ADIRI|nr:unnamed protein product [Adineta ricciae]
MASRASVLIMTNDEFDRGSKVDKQRTIRIENLRTRLNALILKRHDELMKVYSHAKINRSVPTPPCTPSPYSPILSVNSAELISSQISLKIDNIVSESDSVLIDMIPTSCDIHSEPNQIENDSIYPEGITDLHPYSIAARYRKSIGQSTNFREYPLIVAEDSIETLMIGLDDFANQHDCMLVFSDNEQQYDQSIYRAACGVADLGSIHLLANDLILTANFQFEIDLSYHDDIANSEDGIRKFVFNFCDSIAKVLSCESNVVRIFSISQADDESYQSEVIFGLTTIDRKITELLARKLQVYSRSGFSHGTVLDYVNPKDYECVWKSNLHYLQIRSIDLDPQYNYDYRQSDLLDKDTRGGCPYFLPIGWFRHGLNVSTKYGHDQTWIGHVNAPEEWPVAFHGTCKEAVTGIVANEVLLNEVDQAGLYVATHCHGGADLYTTPFTVTTSADRSEQFRIVFQCRVEPRKFTTHTSPVNEGEAWRFVDPNAIRPYGILLKKDCSNEQQDFC